MSKCYVVLAIVSMIVSISSGIPAAIQGWKGMIWKKRRDDAVRDDKEAGIDCSEEDGLSLNVTSSNGQKDYAKYTLDGSGKYGKGRLVLEVIKKYVAKHCDVTYEDLVRTFPKQLRGRKRGKTFWGCMNLREDAMTLYAETGKKRHFLEDDEIIRLSDGTEVAVSSQWGVGNINLFIDAARKLGFKIMKVENRIDQN